MNDILVGLAILGLLSGCLFWCGQVVSRRAHPGVTNAIATTVFAGTVAFAVTVHGRLVLARILPLSNVVVLGNWIPLGAALLMGIVYAQTRIPRWRRLAVCTMFASLAWYTVAYDLLTPAPRASRPQFSRGVCVQTTPASCSPCCAVTLLMYHGIQASEDEMIDLCLTRSGGTPELGLYRGIKLKTRGTDWDVRVHYGDVQMLKQPGRCPALLLVSTESFDGRTAGPRWLPDHPNHAVIVYGIDAAGMVDVGNPSCGTSRWTIDELRRRWHRRAITLAPKRGARQGI